MQKVYFLFPSLLSNVQSLWKIWSVSFIWVYVRAHWKSVKLQKHELKFILSLKRIHIMPLIVKIWYGFYWYINIPLAVINYCKCDPSIMFHIGKWTHFAINAKLCNNICKQISLWNIDSCYHLFLQILL